MSSVDPGRLRELILRVAGTDEWTAEEILPQLDSIALVELLVLTEAEFDIVIPDEKLSDASLSSVESLMSVVHDLVEQQHPPQAEVVP